MKKPMLLPRDHPQAPKYWMQETGGKLVPAMQRYLRSDTEQPDDANLIRAYLRQWVDSPVWDGDKKLDELRRKVRELRTRRDIDLWIQDAVELGMDPL